MLQLTLAYVLQATLEREVETELQHRQMLRAPSQSLSPVEPPAPSSRGPRPSPVRARATGR